MPADMAYFAARVRWAGSRDLTGYIPAVICARKMAATACRGRLCPRPGRRPDQRSGAAACRRRLPAPASPARMLPPARQQPDTGHLGQGPGGLLHRPQPGPAARAGCVSGGRPPPAPDRCRPRATAPRCRRIRPVHARRPRTRPPRRDPPPGRQHHRAAPVHHPGPGNLPDHTARQERLGHRQRPRHRGVPGHPARQPPESPDRAAALLHLGPGQQASPHQPCPRAVRPPARGYHGPTLTLELQRDLFRRWTTTGGVHPHEALTGLLALIHGASSEELRALTISDLNPARPTARLGRRPQPTPLDPATWAAVERCLAYHHDLRTANPHLLVTRKTRATRAAASEGYIGDVLRPADVQARLLRCTRLAELAASTDPKLVSAAFGIHPQAATHYLADHVDAGRSLEPDGDRHTP